MHDAIPSRILNLASKKASFQRFLCRKPFCSVVLAEKKKPPARQGKPMAYCLVGGLSYLHSKFGLTNRSVQSK